MQVNNSLPLYPWVPGIVANATHCKICKTSIGSVFVCNAIDVCLACATNKYVTVYLVDY